MNFDLASHTIYECRHGSHAYGTNVPTSDVDIKGVCVQPFNHVVGFAYPFEQSEELVSKGHPHDKVVYELRKFFRLAADCNPNIIEVLFCDANDVLRISPAGMLLRDNRDMFLSKKARHTFSGYAHAQLKRIKSHRKWLLDPPTHKPTREEYKCAEHKVTPDQIGALEALDEGMVSESVMELLRRERQYKGALDHWNQYQNWKATRNAARAELEAKHGYDTKHAMHLIRLMRMCREILSSKGVIVRRPDAIDLHTIRAGGFQYDEIINEAEVIEAECAELYVTSTLPHGPDIAKLNQLCADVYFKAIGSHSVRIW